MTLNQRDLAVTALQQIARGGHLHVSNPTVRATVAELARLGMLRKPPAPARVTRRVDPTGTTRRLRALTLEGWSQAAIAEATGYSIATIKEQRRGDRKYTSPEFRDAVRELYEAELSPEIEEARQHQSTTIASSKGWLSRSAWADRDIDDPGVHPAASTV